MFLLDGNEASCCGCGVCAQACARNCIVMKESEEGFSFPVVHRENCSNCHLCEQVCPFENKPLVENRLVDPILIAAAAKDENCIMASSSGGAFPEIVKAVCREEPYAIWGAAFDENLELSHHCVTRIEDLGKLRKSKYLQSDQTAAFSMVRQQLRNQFKVVFSGTPCGVAALQNYLREENTANLICIDLVCHGVPNQACFNEYCKESETRYRSKIKSIQFRYKRKKLLSGKWDSRNILIETENGKRYIENRFKNRFLRAYHAALFSRESCYSCIYAEELRQGDLTIADFWGIRNFYPDLDVNHGVSLIQASTQKGLEILQRLNETMMVYPIEREKYLPLTVGAMKKPAWRNKKREKFFLLRRRRSFGYAVDRCVPKLWTMLKSWTSEHISKQAYYKIKKILKR